MNILGSSLVILVIYLGITKIHLGITKMDLGNTKINYQDFERPILGSHISNYQDFTKIITKIAKLPILGSCSVLLFSRK